jgi:hypothetical protein
VVTQALRLLPVLVGALVLAGAASASPGLVAAYDFDAGVGTTLADLSGNGNDGTISHATWSTDGHSGAALAFDGSSSLVTIPDAPALDLSSRMTLEAWVKPAALGATWRTVLFKQQPGGMVYSLYAGDGDGLPTAQVEAGAEWSAPGPDQLPLGEWTHLAATYDGSFLALYVDGAQVQVRFAAGAIPASTGPLRIGGNTAWPEWFDGLIDDVRVYSRVLPQSEIWEDMATPVAPPAPPGPDTSPPHVEVTAPAENQVVTGTVVVSATALDDIAAVSVQLTLDGLALGPSQTREPGDRRLAAGVYWATVTAAEGAHTVTATARDAAGNVSISEPRAFVVARAAPNGLVAAYSFDEPGTTVRDSSGAGNNGTAANTTWTSSGRAWGALAFNGRSSWVTIKNSPSLELRTGMTLEAWVNGTTFDPTWRTVLFKQQPSGSVYALYGRNGDGFPDGQVTAGGVEYDVKGLRVLPVGKWTHLAVTRDGPIMSMYVNGALQESGGLAGPIAASTGPLRIGGNSIWPEWFQGLIDEVRVYDRALTQDEIRADMLAPVGLATP